MAGKLTVKQAADELSVHPETIRLAIRSGELPAKRDRLHSGGPYFIAQSDLDAFRAKRTR